MRLPSTARDTLVAALFIVSAATGGCTSTSVPPSQCLNPQPLPPWACGGSFGPTGSEDASGAPAPREAPDGGGLGGSGGTATEDAGRAADEGVPSAPQSDGGDRDDTESDTGIDRQNELDASSSDLDAQHDGPVEAMTEAGE